MSYGWEVTTLGLSPPTTTVPTMPWRYTSWQQPSNVDSTKRMISSNRLFDETDTPTLLKILFGLGTLYNRDNQGIDIGNNRTNHQSNNQIIMRSITKLKDKKGRKQV